MRLDMVQSQVRPGADLGEGLVWHIVIMALVDMGLQVRERVARACVSSLQMAMVEGVD